MSLDLLIQTVFYMVTVIHSIFSFDQMVSSEMLQQVIKWALSVLWFSIDLPLCEALKSALTQRKCGQRPAWPIWMARTGIGNNSFAVTDPISSWHIKDRHRNETTLKSSVSVLLLDFHRPWMFSFSMFDLILVRLHVLLNELHVLLICNFNHMMFICCSS